MSFGQQSRKRNSLAYMGVTASTPPDFVMADRMPTDRDYKEFNLGDLWLDTTNQKVWVLVSKDRNIADWRNQTGGGTGVLTLTGDSGGAVSADGMSNINTLGNGIVLTVGDDPGATVTWSLGGSVATSYLTDDMNSAIPSMGVLEVLGGTGVNTSSSGNTVTITADGGSIPIQFNADVSFAVPIANFLNVIGTGGVDTIGNASNTLTITNNGSLATQYDCDTSFAVPSGGVLNVEGGFLIATSGNGANILTIDADPGLVVEFRDNSMTAAVGVSGILNIVGASGVTTSASGNTLTISAPAGGAGINDIAIDFNTAPGTNPVVPSGGTVDMIGATVANATNANAPIATHSRAANQMNIELQTSVDLASAPGDKFDAGICSFDDQFAQVDMDGWVQRYYPGFTIKREGTLSNVTGDGTTFIVPFNLYRWDHGTLYNTGTSRFTPNRTGAWLIQWQLGFVFPSSSYTTMVDATIQFVNATRTITQSFNPYLMHNRINRAIDWSGSVVMKLTQGDATCRMQARLAGSSKVASMGTNSKFTAVYLGPAA